MKFIKSSVEIVKQGNTIVEGFKHIEKAARNCYKSEDKITDLSYQKMIDMLKASGHYSPLEHMTIYLTIRHNISNEIEQKIQNYTINPYSKVIDNGLIAFITTNLRVLIENDWLDDLYYMEPPTLHELRVTVKVNCSIGVSREFNRHRVFSISEQSTRYCNYSKDKFGSEITFVIPQWIYRLKEEWARSINSLDGSSLEYIKDLDNKRLLKELSCHDRAVSSWLDNLKNVEQDYMYLIKEHDFKPQEARSILPLDTATCVYYTATISQWEEFFKLRCSQSAHPDIRIIAESIKRQFIENDLI